ncbi:hypothetical protein BS50DRAFT_606991 [Corynespora cassiicola Philippines]|uniref:Integral membrane protein n=1 Tax=Corynespora cassiicola Philippines TaxID=1448308 RepID=A0A2T2P6K1_CORCC|nr:hypothetical protein BS50DRAFT_606991 [Corynespora cassiicola Philippines]
MRFTISKSPTDVRETQDGTAVPRSGRPRTRAFPISNKAMDRACAYSGLIYVTFSFVFFIASGNFPPHSPSLTADEVVAHYRKHDAGYKVGSAFFLLAGAFYGSFTAAMSQQMKRIPNVSHTTLSAQEVSGAWACITFSVPAIFFATTAYRLDRDPAITQALDDLSWMMTFMPFSPFIVQNWAFAFAILQDPRPRPLFPAWVGWLNAVSPILLGGGIAMHCAKTGPLAWNGAITFWLTAIIFGLQSVANIFYTVMAIERDIPAEEHADG